jgi:hypothetical protein
MFTKQHYEAIAKIINRHTSANGSIKKHELTRGLADMFEQDNERFSREKFLVACYEDNPSGRKR